MRRQAPPLEAIEAFILATRSSSFRDAAERLALSPSAFSRRIQALEAFVGVPLFVRAKGNVTLSKTGKRYLGAIEPAIDVIRRATVDLQAERGVAALRIVTPQSFAIGWLIPRLPDYRRANPLVKVELRIGRALDDLRKGHADIAIFVGPGDLGRMPSVEIAQLDAILVSAPQMADGSPPPTSINDLANYDRLAVYQPEGLWDRWLRNTTYSGGPLRVPTYHEAQFLMLEAAAAGFGLALSPSLLAHRLLDQGRLVQPISDAAPIGVNYSLVYADEAVHRRPDTASFTRWLLEAVASFESEWQSRIPGRSSAARGDTPHR